MWSDTDISWSELQKIMLQLHSWCAHTCLKARAAGPQGQLSAHVASKHCNKELQMQLRKLGRWSSEELSCNLNNLHRHNYMSTFNKLLLAYFLQCSSNTPLSSWNPSLDEPLELLKLQLHKSDCMLTCDCGFTMMLRCYHHVVWHCCHRPSQADVFVWRPALPLQQHSWNHIVWLDATMPGSMQCRLQSIMHKAQSCAINCVNDSYCDLSDSDTVGCHIRQP